MSINKQENFRTGQPAGVSNITRDSSGNIVSWTENGFSMTLRRDASTSKPIQLTARPWPASGPSLVQTYKRDSSGNLTGYGGDYIPSALASQLEGGASSVSGAGKVVTSLRVATFGDSTADWGSVRATASTDQQVCDVAFGGALVSLTVARNKTMIQNLYPAARIIANGGIGGQTVAQMIARETLAVSATRKSLQDVIDLAPDLIIFRGGSINSISGFTTATPQASIDAVFDQHMQIIYAALAAGVPVLDTGIAGYDASGGVAPAAADLAFIRATIVQLNARYKAAIAALPQSMVRYLDLSGITHDGTGAYKPAITHPTDGTHLTPFGQYQQDLAVRDVLTSWFGTSAPNRYNGTNLLGSLAQMPAVSTTGIGDTPTGFAWGINNATRANAKVENRNGKRWATCEFTTTGASPYGRIDLPFGINGASPTIPIVSGSQYGIEAEFFIETLDGAPLGNGCEIVGRIDVKNGGTGRTIIDESTTVTPASNWQTASLQRKVIFPVFQAPDGSANLAASNWYVLFMMLNGQNYRCGVTGARIVKLT